MATRHRQNALGGIVVRVGGGIAFTGGLIVCLLALPQPGAEADSTSLPPSVEAIVLGDVSGYQWMLDAVNADAAWTVSTGSGSVVAVIDTGVDASHPDLQGQVVSGAMVVNDADGKPTLVPATVEQTSNDWYGHGSHVSGIVAGDEDGNGITGIAPDARIMPVALLTGKIRSATSFLKMVRAGIEYASDNDADVINMSLGVQASGIVSSPRTSNYLQQLQLVCDAVEAATASGTVVVAAAGNSGDWGNPAQVPGNCPTAVTVAALAPSFERTYWSSFDATVDLAAPGLNILSVDSTAAELSPTPHVIESGTSMASPVVAGVAALLRSAHRNWTVDRIIDKLKSSAQDIDVPGPDPDTGHGIVDAAAALNVATPLAHPSDEFSTWAQGLVGGPAHGMAVVGWTTPDVHAVTGYTLTVHTALGTTDYQFAADTVRAEVPLGHADGWTVTAHMNAGDVTTYPSLRGAGGGTGERPARLPHVRLDRHGDSLVISWDKPATPDSVDVITAYVGGVHPREVAKLKVDQDVRFPRRMHVDMSRGARWYDLSAHLALKNKNDSGQTIGWGFQRINDKSPAQHGSRVEQILSAGRHAVEVTGGISQLRAEHACGDKTCVGHHATLVIDQGHQVQRLPVRYNASGTFHATVWRDKGDDTMRLRIVGPNNLDSGNFRRFTVNH